LFTFEFIISFFDFWGVLPPGAFLSVRHAHGAFLSESKTPPGVPVRALVIIEKRVQNLAGGKAVGFQQYPVRIQV
jgi:hypothetical protein